MREAFEDAYEISATDLDRELKEYIGRDSLAYLRIPVKKLDLLIIRTVALKPHEAQTHLGNLALKAVSSGETLAESKFMKALEANPKYGPAWAGLGALAEQRGDSVQALSHYRQAAELSPDNFWIQFQYGRALVGTLKARPKDDAEQATLDSAIEHLERSLSLEEDLTLAWAELGYAYGLQAEPSERGVVALKKAMELYPHRSDLALNLLLAHARRGEREQAEAIFLDMAQLGMDSAILSRGQEIFLQMDYRQAATLVRRGETEEAVDLFLKIRQETTNSAFQAQIDQQLEKLSSVGDYRVFIDLYNQCVGALQQGNHTDARRYLDDLASKAQAPWQKRQVDKLRQALKATSG